MLDNVTIVDIMTAVAAILALGISLWTAYISRKNVIATNIAANRIEWIKTVRDLVAVFLDEYEKRSSEKEKLICIYNRTMLYFNQTDRSYCPLVSAMQKCLQEDYKTENSWLVISGAQETLEASWVRMKREAGISTKEEIKITKSVHNEISNKRMQQWGVCWKNEAEKAGE